MNKLDFTKQTPFFINGDFKWYIDEYFQNYINNEQAPNLPKLKDLFCCIVINEIQNIKDHVLIDNNQNIIASYHYNNECIDTMQAKINIIKISKHYDDNE